MLNSLQYYINALKEKEHNWNELQDTTTDVSEALPFFILVKVDFTHSLSMCGWGPITGFSNL